MAAELISDEALELALTRAHALGASQADAIYGDDESLSVQVFEGKLSNLETSRSCGLGLRVFADGRPGYSFTEHLTREAVEQCVRDAIDLSRLTAPLEVDLPEAWKLPEEPDFEPFGRDIPALDAEMLRDLCVKAEASALAADARIFNVPELGAGRSQGSLTIANSRGLHLSRRSASASLGLGVVAKKADEAKMGVEVLATLDPAEFDPVAMAGRAVDRAVSMLGAAPVAAARMPVLFDERIAGSFLGLFSGIFVGEAVQKGMSRLQGKVGKKIASSCLELSTMPRMPRQAGSRLFDGEGMPTASRDLIHEGVLTGFLHNLESARREGCAPTGDACRGYAGKTGAGFANLVVARGDQSTAELLQAHPRLLQVTQLEGSTGCNAVSGEISIGVQGFLIENGKAVQPVDRVTVSGNFFEFLQQIEATGNAWRPGLSGRFVPSLLVSEMAVGG